MTTSKELEQYENIINEYRVINHENKNQLSYLKGMTKNKKVNEYIDHILHNKSTQNEILLNQALLIPTGGLRGLIYSKMLLMKHNKIDYNIHVDKKINSKLMKILSTSTMIDICQIIGVYLDNAIEAVKDFNKKNIIINIYKDDYINIEIINNLEIKIDIEKIDKIGYSTKSENRGYGLILASRIINKNSLLSNERTITESIFKQKLIIKK